MGVYSQLLQMLPVCFVQYGAGVCSWGACAGVSIQSISIAAPLVSVTPTDTRVGPLCGFDN